MFAELVRPHPGGSAAMPGPTASEDVYGARLRLRELRNSLAAVRSAPRSRRWGEPDLFYFDSVRQTQLDAARPSTTSNQPLSEQIARAVRWLAASVAFRRVARAVPGLLDAAAHVPAARTLIDVLAVPDDETLLVLNPSRRIGFRLYVRGVATLHQFQILMLASLVGEIDEPPLPSRFLAACRDADPVVPAGVPMVAGLPFQCFRPEAIQPDGTLPSGFLGSDHWLWGWDTLAAAPRIDGERTILLGEPAYPQRWELERAFPAMPATVELQDVLSPFQVAERLGRLAGRTLPIVREPAERIALAEAA